MAIFSTIALLKKEIDKFIFSNQIYFVKADYINQQMKNIIDTLTAGVGININFRNIVVIDPNGDDATGTIGLSKPFATFAAANAALVTAGITNGLVIVNPGTYNPPAVSVNIFLANTTYYFHPGAVVHKTAGAPIVNDIFEAKVYGYGEFYHDTTPVFVPLSGSKGIIEFSVIENFGTNVIIEVQQFDDIAVNLAIIGKVNDTATSGLQRKATIKHNHTTPAINIIGAGTEPCIVTFENCFIKNNGDNPAVGGAYITHADSYLKLQNCQVSNEGGTGIQPAIATTGTTVVYGCHIIAQATASFSADVNGTLWTDFNCLANKGETATAIEGAGFNTSPTFNRIF